MSEETKNELTDSSAPATTEPEITEATPTAPEQTTLSKKEKSKGGFLSFLFDFFLVLLLAAALGGGAWYLYGEMSKYRVPSQMELAVAEHGELCKTRDELQSAAYHADEQIHMRQRLENLDKQLADFRSRIEEKKASVQRERSRVLDIQNEILREDKTLRAVARDLLPGMPIGDATNKKGKVYRDAVIYKISGNRITLRHPAGQAVFPIRDLVKDNLPDIVRYAFGLDDLVDTSDFEIAQGQPAPKKRKGKLISPKSTDAPGGVRDYEPTAGAPVVDTNASATSIIVADDDAPTPEEDTWELPEDAQ